MNLDVEILARIQFALTVGFHYIYPPLSIGLGVILVMLESLYMWTKNPLHRQMAKFWTRLFALTFSLGVATGIVMEFEFGTNWSKYSHFVGDIFGSALGAEGIFAFFLESGFLALLLFGWDRVSDRLHYFSTWMVCLGAHFSAVWIVVANSWMQTPLGYKLAHNTYGVRAEITDFWAMVFNPSSIERLLHVIAGCWLSGAFLVISVSAWYRLKDQQRDFTRICSQLGGLLAGLGLFLSLFSGHASALIVGEYQPTKLAAMEGIYTSQSQAPLTIFGYVDRSEEKVVGLKVPGGLSYLLYGDSNAKVKGLKEFSPDLWPPIQPVFQAYHLMVLLWGVMCLALVVNFAHAFQRWRSRWTCWFLICSPVLPFLANQVGWLVAEVGRQPWIVWGLLKTKDALSSNVMRSDVLFSLILFTMIYLLLFALFIFLLDRKIKHGPGCDVDESEYRDPFTAPRS